MRIAAIRVPPFFSIILLSCLLVAGYLGTGGASKATAAGSQEPEAFRQLGASVVSLKFYATKTSKAVPMSARAYSKDFIRGDTHYIWWELQLNAKAEREKPVNLFVKVLWQLPDGTEFRQRYTVPIQPKLQHPCLAAKWGSAKQGTWAPGTYRVTILVDDIKVASGEIEVFEKLLKGH